MILRSEFIRLLEQSLESLGYPQLAARLEKESGICVQPQVASDFRDAILCGDCDRALSLLPALTQGEESEAAQARFLLTRQKYLEQVAQGDTAAALRTLRLELTPLGVNRRVLHGLAGSLLAPRDGAALQAPGRDALLSELQHLLPPSLLIPDHRLEELVEQALLSQAEHCHYLNTPPGQQSLFVDLQAGPEQLPTECTQVLEMHTDEVWALQFSGDGRWLASAGKDGCAILWEVEGSGGHVRYVRHLTRSSAAVNTVAFSPDSKWVLTSGSDGRVRLYSLSTPQPAREIRFGDGDAAVNAAAWFPDSRHYLAALLDKVLYIGDVEGGTTRRLKQSQHIYDVAVSRDGSTIVTVGQDRRLRFHRLADGRETSINESGAVTCLSSSRSGDYVLANLASAAIHLWPLGDLHNPDDDEGTSALAMSGTGPGEQEVPEPPATSAGGHGAGGLPGGVSPPSRPGARDPLDALPHGPLQEYCVSSQQERFVIRTCLGGYCEAFVASGGEEGKVRIWHRESGKLLIQLRGHAGTVNAVAWSPANDYLLASASDDRTIRIWRSPVARTNPDLANGTATW